jgi:hypothetical protein
VVEAHLAMASVSHRRLGLGRMSVLQSASRTAYAPAHQWIAVFLAEQAAPSPRASGQRAIRWTLSPTSRQSRRLTIATERSVALHRRAVSLEPGRRSRR